MAAAGEIAEELARAQRSSDFELFLLLLILAAFGSFAATLAWVGAGYTRWRDGHPARIAAEPPRTRPAAAVARQHA